MSSKIVRILVGIVKNHMKGRDFEYWGMLIKKIICKVEPLNIGIIYRIVKVGSL